MVVGKLPSNQDRLIHLHRDLGLPLISAIVMIQTWPLQGDVQFEGGNKARITPDLSKDLDA